MTQLVKDSNGRVAIVISRNEPKGTEALDFIPLMNRGFDLLTDTESEFDKKWKPVKDPDWAIERMATLFKDFAQVIGASSEAMEALSKLCKITPEEMTAPLTRQRIDDPTIPRRAPRAERADDPALPQVTDLAALRRQMTGELPTTPQPSPQPTAPALSAAEKLRAKLTARVKPPVVESSPAWDSPPMSALEKLRLKLKK